MKRNILIPILAVLVLTGCVSREQADVKLGRACESAVNVFLDQGQTIDRVKGVVGSASPVGQGYRHITLQTVMVDGWLEVENDYECIFDESFGFMRMGYTASIYQVRLGDEMIGKSGNEIIGSAQDFVKMTDAVREALYE